MFCTTVLKVSLGWCKENKQSLPLSPCYDTKLRAQHLLILRCRKLYQLTQGHTWWGAFCCDLIAQSSFQLLPGKEYWETFDLVTGGCAFRHEQMLTHTQALFTFVKAKPLNTRSNFLLFKPLQFFPTFSQWPRTNNNLQEVESPKRRKHLEVPICCLQS